ncbi:MAG: thermonuclease family protein [Candidatus Pacebacteria bacterium]|nr:thermonuclease family protein [Candidatus Paceibacterota bacterium]MBP9866614.1 thermonuclease family protein [Candidatus Paceibacterota bacterium]
MSAHGAGIPKTANKFLIFLAGIIISAFVYHVQNSGLVELGLPNTVPNMVGVYYKVTKVTDGDTIHIEMDGRDEVVRFIGINTPETVDPRREVECFGKEASSRMKELASGKIVRLEYDESQSTRDTYNRILAYVYLEDNQMLNRKMIAEGYAYEYTYLTPYKYQKEFRDLQAFARNSERGLWSPESCNGSKKIKR